MGTKDITSKIQPDFPVKLEKKIYLYASIALIICVLLDMAGYEQIMWFFLKISLWDTVPVHAVRALIPDGMDPVMDAFYTIWGVTITVSIFAVQISEAYQQFGINLKIITRECLRENGVKRGIGIYLLLFPAIFLSNNAGGKMICLWCLGMAFFGLSFMLWFIQKYSKKREIWQLVEFCTLKQLQQGYPGEKQVLDDGEHQAGSIRQWMDSFLITDMLEHEDYAKADDVNVLVRLLSRILTGRCLPPQEKQWNLKLRTTLLFTWAKRIALKSGFQTEYEKERTLNLFRELWEQITYEVKDSSLLISYSVHLLLPFIDVRDPDGNDMFLRLRNLFGVYGELSLPYVLLYTEYRYWFVDGTVHDWIVIDNYDLQIALDRIRNGKFVWDERIAWTYWLDWSQYNGSRGDIGIDHFRQFSLGMKVLGKMKSRRVCTPVILKL